MNSNYSILIAEDDRHMQILLKHNLKKEGWCCEIAWDGYEAKKLLEEKKYDLLISDIMMPKMTGIELSQWIRSVNDLKDLPIVLLSAQAQETDRQKGFDAGVNYYLVKPFQVSELIKIVKKIFEIE